MKILKFLLFYIYNFTFYRFTFNFLIRRSEKALNDGFIKISEDLNKIDFPYEISISTYFFVILISFLLTTTVYFNNKNLFNENINQLGKNIVFMITINTSLLFGTIYLFNIFNLSRLVLALNIILYPVIYIFLWGIVLIIQSRKKDNDKMIAFVFASIIAFVFILNLFFMQEQDPINIDYVAITETDIEDIEVIEIKYEETCEEWNGSENFVDCVLLKDQEIINLGNTINNLRVFNEEIFVIYKTGLITKYDLETGTEQKFFDLSSKVTFQEYYGGLFDIAFDPNNNFFILSYESNNKLVLEKFNNNETLQGEILLEIPEGNNETMSLNMSIIYSQYFEDFIVSVGDFNTYVSALNTSSPIGKIFLLNKEPKFKLTPITNFSKDVELNLLAFGIRNAWQIYEYNNFLFMTDVGHSNFEELNILNYENQSTNISFGWPIFEGVELYNNYENYISQLNNLHYWNGDEYFSGEEYIKDNSKLPSVYYAHSTPSGFLRSAAIGGSVITDENSKYFENYFFADYASKEIFQYDFKSDELFIYPFKYNVSGAVTALTINPLKTDSLLISTNVGEIIIFDLP